MESSINETKSQESYISNQDILTSLKKRGYYEIGVRFFEKIKDNVKKRNCANSFQYRLNFSKKKLKSKLLSGKQFFSAQVI